MKIDILDDRYPLLQMSNSWDLIVWICGEYV